LANEKWEFAKITHNFGQNGQNYADPDRPDPDRNALDADPTPDPAK